MKSVLISASVLALAAMASGSSFAEGSNAFAPDTVSAVGTNTRADVRAELAQAQRNGYNVNLGKNWSGDKVTTVSTTSRAQVRREAADGTISTSALERNYPVVR